MLANRNKVVDDHCRRLVKLEVVASGPIIDFLRPFEKACCAFLHCRSSHTDGQVIHVSGIDSERVVLAFCEERVQVRHPKEG